jgi:hypothetical protein
MLLEITVLPRIADRYISIPFLPDFDFDLCRAELVGGNGGIYSSDNSRYAYKYFLGLL